MALRTFTKMENQCLKERKREQAERNEKNLSVVGKSFLRHGNPTDASIQAYVDLTLSIAKDLGILAKLDESEVAYFESATQARSILFLFTCEKRDETLRIRRSFLEYLMDMKNNIELVGTFVYKQYNRLPFAGYFRANKEKDIFGLDLLHVLTFLSVCSTRLADKKHIYASFDEFRLVAGLIVFVFYALLGKSDYERLDKAFMDEAPEVFRKFNLHYHHPTLKEVGLKH